MIQKTYFLYYVCIIFFQQEKEMGSIEFYDSTIKPITYEIVKRLFSEESCRLECNIERIACENIPHIIQSRISINNSLFVYNHSNLNPAVICS